MSKKVIVTGGAGFIPSHLNDILVGKGYDVTAVDMINKDKCHNIEHLFGKDNFHYVEMDITDVNAEQGELGPEQHRRPGAEQDELPARRDAV